MCRLCMEFPASVQVFIHCRGRRRFGQKLVQGATSPTGIVTPRTRAWSKHAINLLVNKESRGDRSTGLSVCGLAGGASWGPPRRRSLFYDCPPHTHTTGWTNKLWNLNSLAASNRLNIYKKIHPSFSRNLFVFLWKNDQGALNPHLTDIILR